jgi:hypothetical protein
VLDSQYAVDEMTVAEAILTRAAARRAVVGIAFRNDPRTATHEQAPEPQVRSFRPSTHARSFRPCNPRKSQEGILSIPPERR